MGQPPNLDLVIHGATAITGDPARPLIADAVIGVKANRILLLASERELDIVPSAVRVLNLHGRVITPGLVNVHTHAALSMVRGVAEDLGTAPSYTPGIPHGEDLTPEEARAFARLGALEALLFGSTLINDTFVHAEVTLPAMAELGLRVHASPRIHDADLSDLPAGAWTHRKHIGERTLGEALDLASRWNGPAGALTGVHLALHAPDTCSDDFMRLVAGVARSEGLRVATHLAQSRAEVEMVKQRSGRTPAEALEDAGLLNDRLIAAHCIYVGDSDIRRIGAAGVTVAHVPKGNATGGAMAPTPRLRAAGANLALGTDNMHGDMVEVMRWALGVARVQNGRVDEQWQPAHALEMATRNGAKAMGLEGTLGVLAKGMLADFVAFDFRRPHLTPATNPLGTLVHVGQGRDVDCVVVDGRIVVEGGEATAVRTEEIVREARACSESLWKRISRQPNSIAPKRRGAQLIY